jgi:RecA-family ATPase
MEAAIDQSPSAKWCWDEPPRARNLPEVRAADLEELDPARRWLIEPLWIHAGVGSIGGLPKSCKSWMGLDMAVSVASGTPCLDTFPVRDPGGVLLYIAEDAGSLAKARLRGLCQHRGLDLNALPVDVITAAVVRLDLPLDQQRLAETISCRKPRLLLLDPFVRLHQVNENQAGEWARFSAIRGPPSAPITWR